MRTFFSNSLFLVLASSALYIALSDFPAQAWPLGLVALVPFFFFLHRESSFKRIFWYGLLFGTVTFAGVLVWFLSTYPLEWAGVSSHAVAAATVFGVWFITALTLGVFIAFFGVISKRLARGDWRDLLIVPSVWVLLEYARAFFISLIFWSSQSPLAPDWTLGFFGYSLVWARAFEPFARAGGVYLVAFVGVAINYAFFLVLFRIVQSKRTAVTVCVQVVAVLGVGYGAAMVAQGLPHEEIRGETKTAAVVTTNFRATFSSGLLAVGKQASTLATLLEKASEGSPDIIVLPEDSRALEYLGTTTIRNILSREQKEILLIDSTSISLASKARGRVLFYSSTRGMLGTSDKTFLMPYGEYLPRIAEGLARLLGRQMWSAAFNESRGYERGGGAMPVSFEGHTLGVLFCSEIVPDSPYRNLARDGADIFFNVASHADFHGSVVVYNQILSQAKMKAISNGRFFVQAGNATRSFLIDSHGDILSQSARGEDGVLLVEVGFLDEKTPYTRFGDWVLLAAVIVVGGCFITQSVVRFKQIKR